MTELHFPVSTIGGVKLTVMPGNWCYFLPTLRIVTNDFEYHRHFPGLWTSCAQSKVHGNRAGLLVVVVIVVVVIVFIVKVLFFQVPIILLVLLVEPFLFVAPAVLCC